MKHVFLFLIVIQLFITGCGDEDETSALLSGSWSWTLTSGGFGGFYITPDSVGYTQGINFSQIQAVFYKNKAITFSSNYKIEKGRSIIAEESEFIVYSGNRESDVIVKLTQDSLIIADNHFDGFYHTYLRTQ